MIAGLNIMATSKWRKECIKTYRFYVHKEMDKDVYGWLEAINNKRQYLIDLIRKDMNEHNKPTDKKD